MKICCLALGILCDPSLPQLSHLLNGSNHPSCAHLRQFMRRPSRIVKETVLCHVQLFVTPQTVAHQPPLSMGFSSQEYWSELPSPSPGYLPNPRNKPKSPASPALQMDSLPLSQQGSSLAYDANQYPKFKGFQKQNETKQSKNSWHLCYILFCTLYYSANAAAA